MKVVRVIAVAAAIFALPSAAVGCSIIIFDHSYKARLKSAKSEIEQSTAIVDGEVIRAWTPEAPALVRVHHVLKGDLEVGENIEVGGDGGGGDCTISLMTQGERLRMILNGGPSPYYLYRDYSEARIEDKILKSDRRKVWPYYSGLPDEEK